MADIVTGDIIQERIVCYGQGQISINVRHWRCYAHSGTGGTTAQMATNRAPVRKADYINVLSSAFRFRGVGIQRIFPAPPTDESIDVTQDAAGTIAGNAMSMQTAGVITLRTGVAQRKARGRVYLPFPSEADNDATGKPEAAYNGFANVLAVNLVGSITVGAGGNTSSLQQVVWSRKFQTYHAITDAFATKKWGTQRRRGSYGQANQLPW